MRGCNIGSTRWRRGILKFFVFRSKTSFSSKIFVSHKWNSRVKRTKELSKTETGTIDITIPETKFVARRPTKQQDLQMHDKIFSPKTAGIKKTIWSFDFVGLNKSKKKRKASAKCVHSHITHSFQITITHPRGPRSAVDWEVDSQSKGCGFECHWGRLWFLTFQFVSKVHYVSKIIFFCFTQLKIRMSDDKTSLSEQPETLATKTKKHW